MTQASPVKAVLFDFDGVLTTDKTGSLTTTRYLSARTGIELSRVQSVFRRFNGDLTLGKTTHERIWDDVCRGLGQDVDIEVLREAFESTPLSARMLDLARRLRAKHSVGIVTDNKQDRIELLKKLHDLPSLFDPIVVSAEVGIDKGEPGIFLEAVRRLRIDPQEGIFIDNSRENLIAPGSLGMKTIYFDDEKQDFDGLLVALEALGVALDDA